MKAYWKTINNYLKDQIKVSVSELGYIVAQFGDVIGLSDASLMKVVDIEFQ